MQNRKIGLSIAGFDPSGGAGVLADTAVFAAWGLYPTAVVTAMTIQNTRGVSGVTPLPADALRSALQELVEDLTPSVVKVGMLADEFVCRAVADFLRGLPGIPVVVDPVLRSSSGYALLLDAGLEVLANEVLPLATWVTPNLTELSILTGASTTEARDAEAAAVRLAARYPKLSVVVTGGHLEAPDDFLHIPGDAPGSWIRGNKVESRSTHGTGCTFSTALACAMARFPGSSPREWVMAAKRYVEGAMRLAPSIGGGAGPLAHHWRDVPAGIADAIRE